MGAQIRSGSGRMSRRGKRRSQLISEINVTPFVDVMLVLLIIFMVSAPLMTVGVPIDLPESRAKPLAGDTEPITISVRENGQIFLQDTEVVLDELTTMLGAIAAAGFDERIFVRADTSTDYGEVIEVMGVLNRAGYRRIGLVTTEVIGSE